ncbi:unnamed protein product, partial [Mesorhabditis spiculigera]
MWLFLLLIFCGGASSGTNDAKNYDHMVALQKFGIWMTDAQRLELSEMESQFEQEKTLEKVDSYFKALGPQEQEAVVELVRDGCRDMMMAAFGARYSEVRKILADPELMEDFEKRVALLVDSVPPTHARGFLIGALPHCRHAYQWKRTGAEVTARPSTKVP